MVARRKKAGFLIDFSIKFHISIFFFFLHTLHRVYPDFFLWALFKYASFLLCVCSELNKVGVSNKGRDFMSVQI